MGGHYKFAGCIRQFMVRENFGSRKTSWVRGKILGWGQYFGSGSKFLVRNKIFGWEGEGQGLRGHLQAMGSRRQGVMTGDRRLE